MARNTVIEKIESYDLNDIWRSEHENELKYTWMKKDNRALPPKCARLDFFLVSSSLTPYVTNTNIKHAILTDHSIVSLNIDFSHFQRGRGFFKYNNSLLKDEQYVEQIKCLIKEVTKQYAIDPRTDQFWENIDEHELQNVGININDQLFFDVLLMEIRGETIKYSATKKRMRNARSRFLNTEIVKLEAQLQDNIDDLNLMGLLENAKTELETYNDIEAAGAALRCKALYCMEGERASKYFCSMEKNTCTLRYIPSLIIEGKEIKDQKQIELETYRYWRNIYSGKKTDELSSIRDFLGENNENMPKLSESDKLSCEGEISRFEIGQYLKKIRNNKSPGSTGFTGEFYKFFYPYIKNRLYLSIKHTFEIEKLPPSQNLGITTLIPKGLKCKKQLKNWRPLNLLIRIIKLLVDA